MWKRLPVYLFSWCQGHYGIPLSETGIRYVESCTPQLIFDTWENFFGEVTRS